MLKLIAAEVNWIPNWVWVISYTWTDGIYFMLFALYCWTAGVNSQFFELVENAIFLTKASAQTSRVRTQHTYVRNVRMRRAHAARKGRKELWKDWQFILSLLETGDVNNFVKSKI